ncbi:hypothetical protein AVEN_70929-1 [Araneus ventricosus]|uniref:Uncharacterized protein n=1 Tax=Araneus ventricosus TaxID=182803 RepID=A0A4Y2Q9B5_ARAVE|nr:hypothetical protein AVEN_70929-1 [Araneus ventricosus]
MIWVLYTTHGYLVAWCRLPDQRVASWRPFSSHRSSMPTGHVCVIFAGIKRLDLIISVWFCVELWKGGTVSDVVFISPKSVPRGISEQ